MGEAGFVYAKRSGGSQGGCRFVIPYSDAYFPRVK